MPPGGRLLGFRSQRGKRTDSPRPSVCLVTDGRFPQPQATAAGGMFYISGKLAFLDTIEQHAWVRIFTLAILALVLCSCADSYEILGLHLKPAADDDYDNFGHVPGSGDPE